ncbi:hypothetical protein C8P63_1259 [Melghirimyces profundicolus]|uniref:H+/gluconate symporter-like permease n=1 Tax=Melghirimyces profundicolus TaxID=1242148 RepID=A0A2T6BCV2_9BACL|nr:hypothetical protein [Melghirimyces profundicolus]PTX53891.1 hypothetical protein C8P63_1259 [Melghirimyces profundicolus]
MELSVAHGTYAAVTLGVILTMLLKRSVVLPTLIGTLLVVWVHLDSLVSGLQAVFNANLVAARELFGIFLIITFMAALLRSLKDLGADRIMMVPFRKMMVNGHVSYFLLAAVTYVLSLFFWPTPAVPLIGALLIPPAIRAGLPAMGGAVTIAIAGQGMALSSDYVMQVAPVLSAKAGGIDPSAVADKAMVLSLITGSVALVWAYGSMRKTIGRESAEPLVFSGGGERGLPPRPGRFSSAKGMAVLVPFSLLSAMGYMVYTKVAKGEGGVEGAEGAAFIGGVAAVLLILSTFAHARGNAPDQISEYLVEGFLFAFRVMGPVVPIAGFFFLGSGDFSGEILGVGQNAPSFLFDLVQAGQAMIPDSGGVIAFGILVIGMLTGLDGSGFSGLPLTGGLSAALAETSGLDPATLAAIGQMGSIWTGGGTLVAWSSLVAVAGFAGVSVMELVHKNFVPVVAGLIVSTLVALILW